MITRETDYALRAMLWLGRCEEGSTVATSVLAREMAIPYRFLRRIASKLTNAGLLQSSRGKGGGLKIAKPTTEINLLDIICAVDAKDVALNSCLTERNCCSRSGECVVHATLQTIQDQIHQALSDCSLDELLRREQKKAAPVARIQ